MRSSEALIYKGTSLLTNTETAVTKIENYSGWNVSFHQSFNIQCGAARQAVQLMAGIFSGHPIGKQSETAAAAETLDNTELSRHRRGRITLCPTEMGARRRRGRNLDHASRSLAKRRGADQYSLVNSENSVKLMA